MRIICLANPGQDHAGPRPVHQRRCTTPRGNEPLGEIATKVLFENDRVKIWNLIIEPGGTCPWHLHERDYITVRIAGDPTTLELEDGTTLPGSSEAGQWQYHTDHKVHRILNHNNDSEYSNILIELKD